MNHDVLILSDAANRVVLKTPRRRFPGIVFQGDTLHALYKTACAAVAASPGNDSALMLRDELHEALFCYQEVLESHNIELPYSGRVEAPE